MNNLLQSQIQESCKLALPEGLKDLMSDISREVLRAQPQNLCQFIANYLEALLEAREVLTIACHICKETCECSCEQDLEHDLIEIGLDHQDVEDAVKHIVKHFESGTVKEMNILLKLMKITSMDVNQISAVQEAIQKAFKRDLIKNRKIFNEGMKQNSDQVVNALHHTIQTYEQRKIIKIDDTITSEQEENYVRSESTTSIAGSYSLRGLNTRNTSLPEISSTSTRSIPNINSIINRELWPIINFDYDQNTSNTNSAYGKDVTKVIDNTSTVSSVDENDFEEINSVQSINTNEEDTEEEINENTEDYFISSANESTYTKSSQ